MVKHEYYYSKYTDDVVTSQHQNFQLPDDYDILPDSKRDHLKNYSIRTLTLLMASCYTKLFLKAKIHGKEKLRPYRHQGIFIYGNHTQPFGDVVTPFSILNPFHVYAIANQANWGIPVMGKTLVRYGGLPVGNNIKQSVKLVQAVRTTIKQKGQIVIYPEAHVWPYYTKLRPFSATSFHFPAALGVPVFSMVKTYQKPHFGKRPVVHIYIDGPFLPKPDLTTKQSQNDLYKTVKSIMTRRVALSNYEYCHYTKINDMERLS